MSYEQVLKKIDSQCRRQNRSDVKVIAVSKKQNTDKIKSLYNKGQKLFAENYVQEYLEKRDLLRSFSIEWHFIGAIQSNKVSKIIGEFSLIHSVDSIKILKKINECSMQKQLTQDILLQINIANEKTKSGFAATEVESVLRVSESLKNIRVLGFMIMPPFTNNPEESRVYFKLLKDLLDKYNKKYPLLSQLSMGTTQDYEIAIQEGASFVRIGEALFGKRI